MDQVHCWRRAFLIAWAAVLAAKLLLAARLPLFVDEAFYWLESQHLAWSYSDVPGLTAWLIRLGVETGGSHPVSVRFLFLLLGAALPWMVARIASRWLGPARGWQAGLLALLMPLSASIGLLALPDVPMAFATLLCLDAGARLLKRVDSGAAALLAAGLVIGALSHYRFVGVIAVGFLALMAMREGRRLLREPRVLVALAVGAAGWIPVIAWNLRHGDAGLRFQLLERHPWSFHLDGAWFVLIQLLMVTPLLALAMFEGLRLALGRDTPPQWRYFALLGGISTLGLFLLGFFADNERVSFHWTLPGYFALLVLAPLALARWPALWRRLTWGLLAAGLLAVLGWHAATATPQLREQMAMHKLYPSNFAGWEDVARAVGEELAAMPPDTELVADNFKLGAELAFLLDRADIRVLAHPANEKHGRAAQLRLWGLTRPGPIPGQARPALLVIGQDEVRYRELLAHYQTLCRELGPIVPQRIVNVDRGAQRFVLARLGEPSDASCRMPGMAYVDAPVAGGRVGRRFVVEGWAFREGVGLSGVDILIDGLPQVSARYGLPSPGVAGYWGLPVDGGAGNAGFRAEIDASALPPGRHWLGLRLHGADGRTEDWKSQPVELAD